MRKRGESSGQRYGDWGVFGIYMFCSSDSWFDNDDSRVLLHSVFWRDTLDSCSLVTGCHRNRIHKVMKEFKTGSVHEATFFEARSSKMLTIYSQHSVQQCGLCLFETTACEDISFLMRLRVDSSMRDTRKARWLCSVSEKMFLKTLRADKMV